MICAAMLGAGSWHVSARSPMRAAPLPLINTVLLPLITFPWLVGGIWKATPGGVARWAGWLVAILPSVAAGSPIIFTSVLNAVSKMPLNGWGKGVGICPEIQGTITM